MRLGNLACVLVLVMIGCGPSSSNGTTGNAEDADGDGISDVDEGRAQGTDTDGDGTPDYLDEDSDGDGIPDYREAGDTNTDTAPVDSDGDGTPDFRDLDSDNNGRLDSVDGIEDLDGDGKGNYADLDDDGDQIDDVFEIGPNADQPIDSDNDGTPDFQDTDSDNDTIMDIYETALDDDGDGTPNYLDFDSDGDCILDVDEARGNPPADTDGDGRYDFRDRDSDGDGLLDGAEDANCNGVVDSGETSGTNQDSDGDGVTDLVETAAGTDPNNANDNPQANGDYVFVEPYQDTQSPLDDDLDFKTNLQSVDMYVMVDRSGSMSTEISSVKANLSTVVNNLTCAPLGAGTPPNCIPDLWAGAASIGYSGTNGQPFTNHVDIQPAPSFSSIATNEPSSGCCAEPLVFGAHAAITGQGSNSFSPAVPARSSCAGSPAANAGYNTFGYPCFRQGALPVVLLATDEAPMNGGDTNHNPNWTAVIKPEYVAAKARLVGILGSGVAGTQVDTDLQTMASDTGAVDAANGNAPLVFDGAGANAASAIQTGILTLANGLPLDINAVPTDDPNDSVDSIAAFVDHLETLQLGTAQCANGLTDVDSDGDTFKDKFVQVQTGTPVCWKVVSKPNTTVPATDQPQLFQATVTVFGDGITVLDTRDVYFLVPPAPADPPLQ